ncbi:alpha-glycosidase [Paenibacillus sp. M1]|uniref:Alpha-glycosidase n=1 Tax=Paenibacillus haidiansis TaxID=1574488 RepID=A0ABU7VZW6_9BACL
MKITREAVYHRPNDCWAYGYDDRTVHLRIRTKRGESPWIKVLFGDKCRPWNEMDLKHMDRLASDELFDYWQAEAEPPYGRLAYGFLVSGGGEELWYTEKGFNAAPPAEHLGLFEFPYLHPADNHTPPGWVKESVFYQIFPERFANGNRANDPESTAPWGDNPSYGNFFGGDLQGVMDHLDYLSDLGINAIYFTPLFSAPSNHKYDTEDYYRVDPHFGTKETLRQVVEACHARGIRVILDGVFNHSGISFPYFQDVIDKGKESVYYDWFHIDSWPLEVKANGVPTYKTFAFERTMPKLNTANPEVRNYFCALGRYWIVETGIDGWRLDVANEPDHAFWREFRKAVKEVKPDAYILGEVWHDGMKWLRGDQFDGVMNYPLANAMLDFFVFGQDDSFAFANKIGGFLARYPKQVNEACFNHLDTHDTVRLLTLCGGDKRKLKLAAAFQFTFIGTPSIYYGDEIGLSGQFDPENRRCMIWDPARQDLELYSFYRRLIGLRKSHPALTSGAFVLRFADKSSRLLVYERSSGGETLLVAMNSGAEIVSVRVQESRGDWEDVFTGERLRFQDGTYVDQLGPYAFRILKSTMRRN